MHRILITNDDGFHSLGLLILRNILRDTFKEQVEVVVVAPAKEKSACGHGLNINSPMRLIEVDRDFYKLDDGGPADCVFLALNAIYKNSLPDLVLSGINLGSNMGEDITYSGTVAGAMEGTLHGIPSIAFSQVIRNKSFFQEEDFSLAKQVVCYIVSRFLSKNLPLHGRKFLNVNIPCISTEDFKGYKVTQKGVRIYRHEATCRKDPRGNEYYWIGTQPLLWKSREEGGLLNDFDVIKQGFASITPITLNFTSYCDIENVYAWLELDGNKKS